MSLYRAKGLEFNGVVVVFDYWPYEIPNPNDFTKEELELRHYFELCLMCAAMMQAKYHLSITAAQGTFLNVIQPRGHGTLVQSTVHPPAVSISNLLQ